MAQKLRFGVVLASLVALTAWAEVSGPSVIATPPQPQWSELTIEQKTILAPLSDDWDAMEYHRQKKWLGITRRFPNMTPEEQRRVQTQMQDWGKLAPEARRLARENFAAANKLPLEKKQELKQKWEEYSNLPEEEKARLKQQAASKAVPRPGRTTTETNASTSPPAATPAASLPAISPSAVPSAASTAEGAPPAVASSSATVPASEGDHRR